MKELVLPKAYALSCSPLLQGDALLSLQEFFKILLRLDSPHLKFSELLAAIFAAYNATVGDDLDPSSGYGNYCLASIDVAGLLRGGFPTGDSWTLLVAHVLMR